MSHPARQLVAGIAGQVQAAAVPALRRAALTGAALMLALPAAGMLLAAAVLGLAPVTGLATALALVGAALMLAAAVVLGIAGQRPSIMTQPNAPPPPLAATSGAAVLAEVFLSAVKLGRDTGRGRF